jgi:hypothetical protein
MARDNGTRVGSRRKVVAIVLVAVLLAPVAWIGVRAFVAYDALVNAEARVDAVALAARSAQLSVIPVALEELADNVGVAADLADDPVWRVGEAVPGIGPQLVAAHQVLDEAEALTLLAAEEFGGEDAFRVEDFLPSDGVVDLTRIDRVLTVVESLGDALVDAEVRIATIDRGPLVGPVRSALDQVGGLMTQALAAYDQVKAAIDRIPALYGAEGERTYLVLVGDRREDHGVLGAVTTVVELSVDSGRFAVVSALPATELEGHLTVPDDGFAPILASTAESAGAHLDALPEFEPIASAYADAWEASGRGDVDVVLGTDTVALGGFIGAIGGLTVDGQEFSGPDAVAELRDLGRSPAEQEILLTSFASTAIAASFAGAGSVSTYLNAAGDAYTQRRAYAWGRDEAEQLLFSTLLGGGTFPSDEDALTVGAFLDVAPGVMDADLVGMDIDVQAAVCDPGGRRTVIAVGFHPEGQLTSTAIRQALGAGATAEVLVIGPAGSVLVDETGATVLGRDTVGGRPVALVEMDLAASGMVALSFEGGSELELATDVRTGSRLIGAALTFGSDACGASLDDQ